MGSATPSLETIANCDQGRYQHHALMQRPHGSALPDISLIDTRGLALSSGLSDEAINQIRFALSEKSKHYCSSTEGDLLIVCSAKTAVGLRAANTVTHPWPFIGHHPI